MRETPAERRQTSKKGKRAAKRKAPDNESDEEYKMALKDARQQGGGESCRIYGFFATNTVAAACHDKPVYGINCENP